MFSRSIKRQSNIFKFFELTLMSIPLNKPYRILTTRVKRYATHYQIPAEYSLVVPVKALGEEVLCDIRWEDENGELHVIHNALFVNSNLIPLNQLPDGKLIELWEHYYESKKGEKSENSSAETIM